MSDNAIPLSPLRNPVSSLPTFTLAPATKSNQLCIGTMASASSFALTHQFEISFILNMYNVLILISIIYASTGIFQKLKANQFISFSLPHSSPTYFPTSHFQKNEVKLHFKLLNINLFNHIWKNLGRNIFGRKKGNAHLIIVGFSLPLSGVSYMKIRL